MQIAGRTTTSETPSPLIRKTTLADLEEGRYSYLNYMTEEAKHSGSSHMKAFATSQCHIIPSRTRLLRCGTVISPRYYLRNRLMALSTLEDNYTTTQRARVPTSESRASHL